MRRGYGRFGRGGFVFCCARSAGRASMPRHARPWRGDARDRRPVSWRASAPSTTLRVVPLPRERGRIAVTMGGVSGDDGWCGGRPGASSPAKRGRGTAAQRWWRGRATLTGALETSTEGSHCRVQGTPSTHPPAVILGLDPRIGCRFRDVRGFGANVRTCSVSAHAAPADPRVKPEDDGRGAETTVEGVEMTVDRHSGRGDGCGSPLRDRRDIGREGKAVSATRPPPP